MLVVGLSGIDGRRSPAMRHPARIVARAAVGAAGIGLALSLSVRRANADVGSDAAVLAAELLLSASAHCGPATCEDIDGLCKACAHPESQGGDPTATDALAILRVSVGQDRCVACVCDVDGSGAVVATDALVTLMRAVGQAILTQCPAG